MATWNRQLQGVSRVDVSHEGKGDGVERVRERRVQKEVSKRGMYGDGRVQSNRRHDRASRTGDDEKSRVGENGWNVAATRKKGMSGWNDPYVWMADGALNEEAARNDGDLEGEPEADSNDAPRVRHGTLVGAMGRWGDTDLAPDPVETGGTDQAGRAPDMMDGGGGGGGGG